MEILSYRILEMLPVLRVILLFLGRCLKILGYLDIFGILSKKIYEVLDNFSKVA